MVVRVNDKVTVSTPLPMKHFSQSTYCNNSIHSVQNCTSRGEPGYVDYYEFPSLFSVSTSGPSVLTHLWPIIHHSSIELDHYCSDPSVAYDTPFVHSSIYPFLVYDPPWSTTGPYEYWSTSSRNAPLGPGLWHNIQLMTGKIDLGLKCPQRRHTSCSSNHPVRPML